MNPIDEGKSHYLKFGEKYSNPYPRGTAEHNDFERGWSQAMKANPAILERIKKEQSRNYENLKTSSSSTSEAYRNARKK